MGPTSHFWRCPQCGAVHLVLERSDGTRSFRYQGQNVARCPQCKLMKHTDRKVTLARQYKEQPAPLDARRYTVSRRGVLSP